MMKKLALLTLLPALAVGALLAIPSSAFACCGIGGYEITATADPASCWPPNHKFFDVTFEFEFVDVGGVGDPDPTYYWNVCGVTASDFGCGEDGGENHEPDFVINGQELQLRCERTGDEYCASARVYTIDLCFSDDFGTTNSAQATVTVPHSKGK